MNTNPFSYLGHRGTRFECQRCDLSTPINVIGKPADTNAYAMDVAEMIGFHATNIHPQLNGFQGYDTLEFVIQSERGESAEMSLDKVFHAIPEWVRQLYPDKTLAERVALGFESQQKTWTTTYLAEVEEHNKIKQFLIFLMSTHGFDWGTEYWAFLTHKEFEEKTKK